MVVREGKKKKKLKTLEKRLSETWPLGVGSLDIDFFF